MIIQLLPLLALVFSYPIVIDFPFLLPEGIEFNPLTNNFLVGSISYGTIYTVYANGTTEVFVPYNTSMGGLGTLGLHVNGGSLYVASSLYPMNETADLQAAMVEIDLASKSVVRFVELPLGPDPVMEPEAFANDLVQVGNVTYVTDSLGGQVWMVNGTTAVSWLYDESFLNEFFPALNGIEYHPSGLLILAKTFDTDNNSSSVLFRINTTDKTFVKINTSMAVYGADGVFMDPTCTNVLYVVGAEHVYKLQSLDNWWTAAVLQKIAVNSENCVTPTTVVVARSEVVVTCVDAFGAGPYALDKVVFPNEPYGNRTVETLPYLLPEGIENYDDTLLVGSVSMGTINWVLGDGTLVPFAMGGGLLFGSAGIEVDRAHGLLHVANGVFPPNPNLPLQSAYVALNLTTGAMVRGVDLSNIGPSGKGHFANDLCVDPAGNVYITDSVASQIWKVPATGDAISLVTNSQFDADPAVGIGLNGIVYHPDGYLLALKSGTWGEARIFKVSLNGAILQVSIKGNFTGLDGGVLNPNSSSQLFAVGGDWVWQFSGSNGWTDATVIGRYAVPSTCITPTTCTFMNGKLYVSCLNQFSAGPYSAEVVDLSAGNNAIESSASYQQPALAMLVLITLLINLLL